MVACRRGARRRSCGIEQVGVAALAPRFAQREVAAHSATTGLRLGRVLTTRACQPTCLRRSSLADVCPSEHMGFLHWLCMCTAMHICVYNVPWASGAVRSHHAWDFGDSHGFAREVTCAGAVCISTTVAQAPSQVGTETLVDTIPQELHGLVVWVCARTSHRVVVSMFRGVVDIPCRSIASQRTLWLAHRVSGTSGVRKLIIEPCGRCLGRRRSVCVWRYTSPQSEHHTSTCPHHSWHLLWARCARMACEESRKSLAGSRSARQCCEAGMWPLWVASYRFGAR